MPMTPIQSKKELKEFVGKKHLHFCKRCWVRLVCGIADRKDCNKPDGIYCADCCDENDKNFKKNHG